MEKEADALEQYINPNYHGYDFYEWTPVSAMLDDIDRKAYPPPPKKEKDIDTLIGFAMKECCMDSWRGFRRPQSFRCATCGTEWVVLDDTEA
jgi:hypothetical protein